jgi:hypothetical protein
MDQFKPTYLYIKQHKITGLLYFGKTTRTGKLFEKYKGSGKHWSPHIKKHGVEHVETLWYCLFLEKEELVKFALMCSTQWDIVNAKDINGKKIWANQKLEDGLAGGFPQGFGNGGKRTTKTKNKISTTLKGVNTWTKGRKWSDEERKTRPARTGENNPFFNKTHSLSTKEKMGDTWEINTPSGEILIVNNLSEFCRTHNLFRSKIGPDTKYKGYRFKNLTNKRMKKI